MRNLGAYKGPRSHRAYEHGIHQHGLADSESSQGLKGPLWEEPLSTFLVQERAHPF